MKCRHCSIHFHDNWRSAYFDRDRNVLRDAVGASQGFWMYRSALCPGCGEFTIQMTVGKDKELLTDWRQVYPIGANRGPVPTDVPHNVSLDYIEACNVLPISAKASAALSRRCLQTMLHAAGYKAKDLAKEIDLLLNETDPRKALPHKLRERLTPSEILETSLLTRSMTKPLYR